MQQDQDASTNNHVNTPSIPTQPIASNLPGFPVWYPALVSLLRDVGFPIVIAGWLAFVVTNKLDKLIEVCAR